MIKLSLTSKVIILCSLVLAGAYFYYSGYKAGAFESVLPITNGELAPILDQLKDPESAQFRKLKRYERGICGEVNAKNSMGGYTGFERFYITLGKEVKYGTDSIRCLSNDEFTKEVGEFIKQN